MTLLQLNKVPNSLKHHKRYQIMALSKSGISNDVISEFTECNKKIVSRWGQRDTIYDNPRPGCPPVYDEALQLKTIGFYCQTTPLPDCGRWTLRMAGKYIANDPELSELPTSHSTIHRLLQKHNLKPHRSKYFLEITDPDFFSKMELLVQLYLNPPEYLFCFDECPGIQVLQRLAPDLQTENMKIRLEEFEYIRNGAIDVFAFFRVKTGNVFAECKADHKTQTLVQVFEKHLKSLPENETIHYIMDNLASHSSYKICELVAKHSRIKCPSEKELNTATERRQWLQVNNKRIMFHYTPFHGSWLNMVEIWFGSLNQKCLNESFNSPESMHDAIYDFVNLWNTLLAHPFKWNYTGKGLHQKVVNRFIKMLEHNVAKMNVKFITKQFLLIRNLIKNYPTKVKFESWIKLHQLMNSNLELLNGLIVKDGGPKKMIKAKAALTNLIDALNAQVYNIYEKAA